MKRKKLICLMLACALLFCSCGRSAEQTESATAQMPSENTVESTEAPTTVPTTAPVATEPKAMGHTLEEMENASGIFYLLEDGSFARYRAGGFKKYAGMYDGGFDTLFIPKANVARNPILSQHDTIAIFSDVSVSVELMPIAVSGSTVSLTVDDEYVILNPIYGWYTISGISTMNAIIERNHDETTVSLIDSTSEALFGVPLEEIEYTRYEKNYGDVYAEQDTVWSFPDETEITISLVEGTTVTPIITEADYNFYAYGNYYTYYNPDLPRPDINAIPTIDGYAAVSLDGVPAGQYVMIISMADDTYYGTVLTVA